ncbi:hypothetical protein CVV38_04495 [Candidatus Peregrinibacteria bacterium HGW-Peregrinibacteria-1]|jgi:D-alanyl-D-alanine carboxypeptidase|nr:MAG: hypothetical protein CVV38_04495 [Candidatus Peregrinibacteria bacterium HGW-Peregrinibacteria-1]
MITSLINLYIANTFQQLHTPSPALTNNIQEVFQIEQGPVKKADKVAPVIQSRAYLALDLETDRILTNKNINQRLPIASITKTMTALIILEENSLDEVVTVSSRAASTGGSRMNLRAGEKITVKDLLYSIMIHSANDAAYALAEHNAGTVEDFIVKMNQKASDMSLVNTHFQNPAGLDHPDNYSTAYEITRIAKKLYEQPLIKEVVTLENHSVSSVDSRITHKLQSTNSLLGSYLNIKGLKTGQTPAAGACLVAIAQDTNNNEIITVVLNSPDRFRESKILIDWTFNSFIW